MRTARFAVSFLASGLVAASAAADTTTKTISCSHHSSGLIKDVIKAASPPKENHIDVS
jgi:hypothetical protein